jgi:translation initiation factor IF-2
VVPDESARQKAEQMRVEIRTYRVIYEIFDDMKKALSGMLEPEIREKLHGHVEVRQIFKVSKLGNIAGCFVTDGHVQRGQQDPPHPRRDRRHRGPVDRVAQARQGRRPRGQGRPGVRHQAGRVRRRQGRRRY